MSHLRVLCEPFNPPRLAQRRWAVPSTRHPSGSLGDRPCPFERYVDDLPIAASESELNTQPLQPKIPGKGGTEWCGGGRGLSAARRTGTYPLTYSYGDVLAQTTESSFAVGPSPPRYLLAFQRPCNKSCTARRRW